MAGLGVLLETQHKQQQQRYSSSSMILSKASLLSSPPPLLPRTTSFLDSCFLCHKSLSHGKDIYIYRGDRAFCSVECRCKHIVMEEESVLTRENCTASASARHRSKTGANKTTAAGGFAY